LGNITIGSLSSLFVKHDRENHEKLQQTWTKTTNGVWVMFFCPAGQPTDASGQVPRILLADKSANPGRARS
jgi:hypothetical protein